MDARPAEPIPDLGEDAERLGTVVGRQRSEVDLRRHLGLDVLVHRLERRIDRLDRLGLIVAPRRPPRPLDRRLALAFALGRRRRRLALLRPVRRVRLLVILLRSKVDDLHRGARRRPRDRLTALVDPNHPVILVRCGHRLDPVVAVPSTGPLVRERVQQVFDVRPRRRHEDFRAKEELRLEDERRRRGRMHGQRTDEFWPHRIESVRRSDAATTRTAA